MKNLEQRKLKQPETTTGTLKVQAKNSLACLQQD